MTRIGVVDDPFAEAFLRTGRARVVRALQRRSLQCFARNRAFAYLAARTLFYDDAVRRACDEGITQVVIVAAGYDSRAWRLARPGVAFFEVDQPVTQADKRAHAPEGGPVYVPMDRDPQRIGDRLAAAGFVLERLTIFSVEGLTMYLETAAVRELLRVLATIGGPGSQLAVDFGSTPSGYATPTDRARMVATRITAVLGKEPLKFTLEPSAAAGFLPQLGWTARDVLTGPDLGARYLTGVNLPALHPRSAFVALATRT